jgi:hypothetical protein
MANFAPSGARNSELAEKLTFEEPHCWQRELIGRTHVNRRCLRSLCEMETS